MSLQFLHEIIFCSDATVEGLDSPLPIPRSPGPWELIIVSHVILIRGVANVGGELWQRHLPCHSRIVCRLRRMRHKEVVEGVVDDDRRLDAGHKKEIDEFEGQSDGEEDEGGEEEQDGWY